MWGFLCFFFKQKTAYEMRISDWSSDVCSSDLRPWLLDAIDQDTVDELVGEADQALDPGGLVDRFRIVPDDLVVQLACHRDLVIARFALVRALGDELTGL